WRVPVVQAATVVGLVALVLSMGPELYVGGRPTGISLPWRALRYLPMLASVLPVRLVVFAFRSAALVLAVGLDRLRAGRPTRIGAAASCLAVASLAPLFPHVPPATTPVPTPAFFLDGQARQVPAGSTALVLPYPFRPALWQVQSGFRFRMPDGTVFSPGPRIYSQGGALSAVLGPIQHGKAPPPEPAAGLGHARRAPGRGRGDGRRRSHGSHRGRGS
ncbi:MAG: hypothetical protein ACRDZQ_14995, partial [Acidimicrobiales bacterium]